ncbi:hypothetical protein K461DRAFT_48505 [Myriangium duriaei CBS 260.36]|uniref:Uncharacterized protein n=1 Tax=Myriangium duriaei CBS 260.36 TaxID=1168546 RepID=A0A9P4IT68_9PEZI|nr:hypothetical protein K461DRAFT_48505 [Myriangium duriaei CBS 260.36]
MGLSCDYCLGGELEKPPVGILDSRETILRSRWTGEAISERRAQAPSQPAEGAMSSHLSTLMARDLKPRWSNHASHCPTSSLFSASAADLRSGAEHFDAGLFSLQGTPDASCTPTRSDERCGISVKPHDLVMQVDAARIASCVGMHQEMLSLSGMRHDVAEVLV